MAFGLGLERAAEAATTNKGFFSRATNNQAPLHEKNAEIKEHLKKVAASEPDAVHSTEYTKLMGERSVLEHNAGVRNTFNAVKAEEKSTLTGLSHGIQAFGDKAVFKLAGIMPKSIGDPMREHSGAIAASTAGVATLGLGYESFQSYEHKKQGGGQSYMS